MVDLIRELYYKYSPIEKIFVDGSQISFIKSLKIALYNELREETDYQQQIKMYKDSNCDYTLNMKILPVTFTADSSKAMLSALRSLLERGYIMIHPRFEKLILALHTCVDKEGRVDKIAMTHSDVFDSLRMCSTAYHFT
jgi:Terminase RNaseH-like domain